MIALSRAGAASTTPTLSTSLVLLWLKLLRQDVRLTQIQLRHLRQQNLHSSEAVVVPGGPEVSLTTHGRRLEWVYLTIESIAAGEVRPSRIVLWLERESLANRPESLRRLEKRGLQVRVTDNYGPHTKYYPYLLGQSKFDTPMVTADDDVIYCRSWLRELVLAHARDSSVINCHRAHVVVMARTGFAPYRTWPDCRSQAASFAHFATGVSGCIYPVRFLQFLKSAGSAFLSLCPNADDVWLHANAIRSGFRIKQIRNRALDYPTIPATQKEGLLYANVALGGNDRQILNTYTPDDLAIIIPDAYDQWKRYVPGRDRNCICRSEDDRTDLCGRGLNG